MTLLHRRFATGAPEGAVLGWHMPRGRALLPLFGFALLAGFWAMYLWPKLPLVLWQRQGWLFAGLLAALALSYGLMLKRKPLELLLAWLTLTMSGGVWWAAPAGSCGLGAEPFLRQAVRVECRPEPGTISAVDSAVARPLRGAGGTGGGLSAGGSG